MTIWPTMEIDVMRILMTLYLALAPEFGQSLQADEQLGSTMTLEDLQKKQRDVQEVDQFEVLSVQAAAEPVPAIRLRLYPAYWELKPGSALLHFSRAQLLLMQRSEEERNRWQTDEWMNGEGEGEKPTTEQLGKTVESLQTLFRELHDLAMSEDFSADHRLRDLRGPEVFTFIMPDVQESRALARILKMKIRYQILQRDFDGAVTSISDGLRLAEFIGQGETLIQKLVGIAIQSMMRAGIENLIATPGSPNLYWALATIPRPLVSTRDSVMWELNTLARVFPALFEAEKTDWTDAQATEKWSAMLKDFSVLSGDATPTDFKLALAVGSIAFVSPARQRLQTSGFPEERLNRLPALQIILIDAARELRRMGDELGKGHLLPDPLALSVLSQADDQFLQTMRKELMTSLAAVLASRLYPAVTQARDAETRTQMTYARLMTLEALRMHAANSNGQLPNSLEELSSAPALPDPYTGRNFDYSVETVDGSSVVTLRSPGPESYKPMQVLIARFGK
ncbi:MAG: hypothetical protein KDA89_10130 [Planctomycetaceae bacterium]|nr:hypothetical protein [Planctomycetaceae bacterium]